MIDCFGFFIGGNSTCDKAWESCPLFLEASEAVVSSKAVESFETLGLLPPRCSERVESCEDVSLTFLFDSGEFASRIFAGFGVVESDVVERGALSLGVSKSNNFSDDSEGSGS